MAEYVIAWLGDVGTVMMVMPFFLAWVQAMNPEVRYGPYNNWTSRIAIVLIGVALDVLGMTTAPSVVDMIHLYRFVGWVVLDMATLGATMCVVFPRNPIVPYSRRWWNVPVAISGVVLLVRLYK